MKRAHSCVITATLVIVLTMAGSGNAQDWHDHDRRGPDYHHGVEGGYDGGRWRDGDIRHFHEHDLQLWRGGRWFHGPYEGHEGWWWIVGGVWYFYPQPVYPYPDPYLPPMSVAPMPPASIPPGPSYYYCPSPPGYYPYLPSCPSGWRVVPAR